MTLVFFARAIYRFALTRSRITGVAGRTEISVVAGNAIVFVTGHTLIREVITAAHLAGTIRGTAAIPRRPPFTHTRLAHIAFCTVETIITSVPVEGLVRNTHAREALAGEALTGWCHAAAIIVIDALTGPRTHTFFAMVIRGTWIAVIAGIGVVDLVGTSRLRQAIVVCADVVIVACLGLPCDF